MKLRKILAGLWIVLLLLAGTCYAENSENPIISEGFDGYLRLNIPSVKKVEYYGRSYIECSYTQHSKIVLPYGIPIVEETGTYYCWFDPSDNKMHSFGKKHYNASKDYIYKNLNKSDILGDYSIIYRYLLNNFPKLCDEAKLDNQKADEKYGSYLEKAFDAKKNKDWEAEYNYLKKAYDNGCQSQAILCDLADVCWKLGEYDKAIDWVSKRIEVAPSADAYNTRAWDYYLLGKNDLALEDAKWAVMKDKDRAGCFNVRGSIYYELGQYDKAIKDFDTAIKLNDKFFHAYYYRGKSYDAVGKKSDAQSDYKKAKKLYPEITDDKVAFENQRSQAQARKQQAQYQRREKYKEDLKKLNDAIYVTNNANNFSKLDICEQNRVIINVADAIKNNEPEEFYEEVIPQAVRINYENGTYQQQYEQLKAEVEAEQAATIGGEASPQSFPVTLANEDIHEKYKSDLNEEYSISYEPSQKTSSVHGKYILFKCQDLQDGSFVHGYDTWLQGNDLSFVETNHPELFYGGGFGVEESFDYDSTANGTFTFYHNHTKSYIGYYDVEMDEIRTRLAFGDDSRYSGMRSCWDAVGRMRYSLDENLGKIIYVDNSYKYPFKYSVRLYPKGINAKLPTMWYKLTKTEWPAEWTAFTYDKENGLFTIYDSTAVDNVFINARMSVKFLDAERMELRRNGEVEITYGDGIAPYVVDGMRLFLKRISNK